MYITKIKDILIESNHWWKTAFTQEYKERDIYQHISKFFPLPQIIALTDLRRVNKTTLLYKINNKQIFVTPAYQFLLDGDNIGHP